MPRAESPAEPIRLYTSDDARLPRRVSAALAERIAGYSDTILQGNLEPARYNELVGIVKGLKEALQICDDAAKELSDS
jgi:hypothetical protein